MPREDRDICDSWCNWLANMAPSWLMRLNDLLAWLNPALAGVAALLALMVIAAAGRFPANATRTAGEATRPVSVVTSAECPRAALPPKWRDLQLYD
jgi:hypothetical protein